MNDRQIIAGLTALVSAARQHDPSSAVGRVLENALPGGLDADALRWLADHLRREPTAVTLSLEVPGYVWIGIEGEEKAVIDPRLVGIEFAHEAFRLGEIAHVVLRASDFQLSANAARNALQRAARWAENHCPSIAVAIRAVRIDQDGAPHFEPVRPMTVRTNGVFSACSSTNHHP